MASAHDFTAAISKTKSTSYTHITNQIKKTSDKLVEQISVWQIDRTKFPGYVQSKQEEQMQKFFVKLYTETSAFFIHRELIYRRIIKEVLSWFAVTERNLNGWLTDMRQRSSYVKQLHY